LPVDSIFEILALQVFAEMIRKKYKQKPVEFLLPEKKVPAQNDALLDPLDRQISCFSGRLIPAQVQ